MLLHLTQQHYKFAYVTMPDASLAGIAAPYHSHVL